MADKKNRFKERPWERKEKKYSRPGSEGEKQYHKLYVCPAHSELKTIACYYEDIDLMIYRCPLRYCDAASEMIENFAAKRKRYQDKKAQLAQPVDQLPREESPQEPGWTAEGVAS